MRDSSRLEIEWTSSAFRSVFKSSRLGRLGLGARRIGHGAGGGKRFNATLNASNSIGRGGTEKEFVKSSKGRDRQRYR